MASHAYPHHPPTGGKGVPRPAAAPAVAVAQPHHAVPGPDLARSHVLGHPPDLEHRFKLKVRYLRIQKKYFRSLQVRKDLELELAEKEAKQLKLQDEVDLILDQIHQSDYAHLVPKDDNLFSDDDDQNLSNDDDDDSEVDEPERRKQMELDYRVDSTKLSLKPTTNEPAPSRAASATTTTTTTDPPLHPPKRIKLTFGSSTAHRDSNGGPGPGANIDVYS
ncbi:hypothetical protein JCM11491_005952 [Sporobolomyces phaffii]